MASGRSARGLAARVTPTPLKRLHQRWSEARFERRSSAHTREWTARHGTSVRHGPFAGMEYLPERAGVPVLSGAYEAELARWVAAAPAVIVDVGCSEGYYAVGLARAIPAATVYAFDIDPEARRLCAATAELNGVADQVVIESECTVERLEAFPETGVRLLVDCEGCELAILDPAAAPKLAGWPILAELHDFINPSITNTITGRFAATHDVRLIDEQPVAGRQVPELAGLPASERARRLDEHRPERMRWAALEPRR